MKRIKNMTCVLVAAMAPLAMAADEPAPKPVWEVQARLSGGKNPKIAGWFKEVFGQAKLTAIKTGGATVQIRGFRGAEESKPEWSAEIRGLEGEQELFGELEKEGAKRDGDRMIYKAEGEEVVFWQAGPGVVKLVSPAGIPFRESAMTPLPEDTWLAGSVDFTLLPKELVDSSLLKMTKGLSFSASSPGVGASLNLTVKLADADLADQLATLAKELYAEVVKKEEDEPEVSHPALEMESRDGEISFTVKLDDTQLQQLVDEVKVGLKDATSDEGDEEKGGIHVEKSFSF
ncbi:hypothetical protein KBB96_05590 [Luteolibacter ambystomatis]|uniref:DUF945 family protein n=1 Tax=Luteolibacter ambystomatis TaxID=2824561 RepID=A0A975PGJ5_9BACT|nr:hypothetical protein [Luteolibacter ambystomatis]QUE52362.1 hypothetical protein KBB96_05590 [Luteolibacter ambystomatis]